jgi:hypothetical protein
MRFTPASAPWAAWCWTAKTCCTSSAACRGCRKRVSMVMETQTGADPIEEEQVLRVGTDLARLRARVGMVFQKPTPFPMSIYDNIAFGVRIYHRKSKPEWVGDFCCAGDHGARRFCCPAPRRPLESILLPGWPSRVLLG